MKKFVSLGTNCEVAFQIEKYQGYIDSGLFSWAFVLDDEKFLRALENIDDIFTHGVHFHMPSDDMFYDEKYDITFHGRTPRSEMFDQAGNLINPAAYDACLSELRSRLEHLKERTKQTFASADEKIFLRKIEMQPDANGEFPYAQVANFIGRLYDVLSRQVCKGTFKLVIVLEKRHLVPDIQKLERGGIFIRGVDYLAPFYDTKDGADENSWRKILHEFGDSGFPLFRKRQIHIGNGWNKASPG